MSRESLRVKEVLTLDILTKRMVLDEIHKVSPIFIQRGNIQYSIRCPICGDSGKDLTHSHCYIKCSNDPTEPLLYNCFLCNKHGIVNDYFLTRLGIRDHRILSLVENKKFNKFSRAEDGRIQFNDYGEIDMNSPQVKYIESRLGTGFTLEDYERFRILNVVENVSEIIQKKSINNILPNNRESISFLTDDCSVLLTRKFGDFGHSSWNKIRLRNSESKSYYTIKTQLDLFTKEPIIINVAEGVFDILSVYKNFNEPNSVFVAALGSDYLSALIYMIHRGIIGKNVQVRIYIDKGIDEYSLKQSLRQYKWLFDSITILKNTIGKDVGVKIDEIKLMSYKI